MNDHLPPDPSDDIGIPPVVYASGLLCALALLAACVMSVAAIVAILVRWLG